MTTDFSVKDLEKALGGYSYNEDDEDLGYAEVIYEIKDKYKNESWVENGGTTSIWSAKKDENNFPRVLKIIEHRPSDEDYDEDLKHETSSEFWHEGGYVHPYGYFKVLDNGNLGDGHEAWVLIEHQGSGRLFRKSGYYSSWEAGTVLEDDLIEVVPAEVKVIRYRPIDGGEPYDYPAVTVD